MSSQDFAVNKSEKHQPDRIAASMSDPSIEADGLAQKTVTRTDENRLHEMGHEQQLARRFSMPALVALCLSLMATWEALSSYIAPVLVSGGAPCLFYNYILAFVGSICIVCSLAEIASIYPTAGGQYHWVAALCPSGHRRISSWMTGWISVGGQTVLTTSAAFAGGLGCQALITLNHSWYNPKPWHGVMFFWAIVAYSTVVNAWLIKLMPGHNLAAGVIHILGFLAIIITLLVTAEKHTAEYVFTEFTNSSGWNNGVSWLIGLQSAVYPLLGYDAACHLAEELPHASRNVPLAMVGSVVINGLMGLAYTIILLFCSGTLSDLLSTPTGFPFMQIYLDATKSQVGATLMSLPVIFIAIAASVAGTASTSRTLWAFARDRATPFDRHISTVSSRMEVPVLAIFIVSIMQALLGLIYLGNSTALNAVLSMSIIGMYITYGLPIFFMLSARSKIAKGSFGPFRMHPAVGPVINIVSLIFITVVIIFSCFPTSLPVTARNMQYSTVVLAGWIVIGIVYYFWRGKNKFQVPATFSVTSGLAPAPEKGAAAQ
ncbi:amino acid polyamine transporter I [Cordyceps militaris]|uniref:Amino acid polyamine transporter I n=1 Tax=Cordyceps militaris TaxID=73501 RepID=A0A2H4SRA7_CORMI|nr:amino acid polyamine transporter I [Cordyceps militaris]